MAKQLKQTSSLPIIEYKSELQSGFNNYLHLKYFTRSQKYAEFTMIDHIPNGNSD